MTDDSFRIAELLLADMKCSHVLMTLALEASGGTNPELIRAMSGLALGMGQGLNCGALSGGCCVLGLLAGRGGETEMEDPRFMELLEEYSGWFLATTTERHGGPNCADIMRFDPALKVKVCPALVGDCWDKIKEILERHDIDIANPPRARTEEEIAP
ncbi:MAG: C-GCAxxG-C-C family protein [Rhodospirillum sp.]|nr:C-GCAxxG-C-C family protein [Rhodospirillum sp.]MCF8489230.1 C-GCAxxG-C-C family protein [Rhodospirillum sp.]MCF8500533.1 C-GCAxxG-C-C family protein [Rhodospirillum sp.]